MGPPPAWMLTFPLLPATPLPTQLLSVPVLSPHHSFLEDSGTDLRHPSLHLDPPQGPPRLGLHTNTVVGGARVVGKAPKKMGRCPGGVAPLGRVLKAMD